MAKTISAVPAENGTFVLSVATRGEVGASPQSVMRSTYMADHRVKSSDRTSDHDRAERVFACGECGRVQIDDKWVEPNGGPSAPAPPDHRGLCPECADRLIADRARRLE